MSKLGLWREIAHFNNQYNESYTSHITISLVNIKSFSILSHFSNMVYFHLRLRDVTVTLKT